MSRTGAVLFPAFQQRMRTEPFDYRADLRCALLNKAPDLGARTYDEISGSEVSSEGYKPGGKKLKGKVMSCTGAECSLHADDMLWHIRGTISPSHAVIYEDKGWVTPLVAWISFGKAAHVSSAFFRRPARLQIFWDTANGVLCLAHPGIRHS